MRELLNASRTLLPWLLILGAAACKAAPAHANVDRDIFVVRHAEAWSNREPGQRGGRDDAAADALTPEGIERARALADQFVAQGITVVFHSPLGRTRETAQILADRCGADCVAMPALLPMSGNETVDAAAARALAALRQRGEPGNWVVVSHSGVTAALLGEADGTPSERRLERKLPTGGMRCVRLLRNGSLAPR